MINSYKEKQWFKFLSNKYVWILLSFIVWMVFLDNYSFFGHQVLDNQIEELEENIKYYQNQIENDKREIQKLKNPEQVEKYAREKYYMKKENEDVYIIEFKGDSIEKDVLK